MSAGTSPIHPITHLAVDVQRMFLYDLGSERSRSFRAKIESFAKELKKYSVPTTWVAAYPNAYMDKAISSRPRSAVSEEEAKKLGLDGTSISPDDNILVKYNADAFAAGVLAQDLRRTQTGTVVITGMNTTVCVLFSAISAVRAGLRCVIVTDMLADINYTSSQKSDPEWHKHALEREIGNFLGRKPNAKKLMSLIEYTTSDALLAALEPAPAKPAPAQNRALFAGSPGGLARIFG